MKLQPPASDSLYSRAARAFVRRLAMPLLAVTLCGTAAYGTQPAGTARLDQPSRQPVLAAMALVPTQPPTTQKAPTPAASIASVTAALAKLPSTIGAPVAFPFHQGDTVGWCGSSSTAIGVWPRTMEFLLRTRHPGLQLKFQRCGLGGATFGSALNKIDSWLSTAHPAIVFYNFGANDAGAGDRGIVRFEQNMDAAVHEASSRGIRTLLLTPQSADVRKSGPLAFVERQLYAQTMIGYGRTHGWPILDIHHPIAALQKKAQTEDTSFSINRDGIHLTDAGYIAWGYFLYDACTPPAAISNATVSADGEVVSSTNCKVDHVKVEPGVLSFERADEVLPILPPLALPPSQYVPLEKLSRYELRVTDLPVLPPGMGYEISCEGEPIGVVGHDELEEGVNLNSVLLASGNPAPWHDAARQIWTGQEHIVGSTHFHFQIRPALVSTPRQLPESLPGVNVLSHLLTQISPPHPVIVAPAKPIASAVSVVKHG